MIQRWWRYLLFPYSLKKKGNPKFTAFIVQTGGGGVVGVLENAYP